MLQNAYFLAKIGADTAENEQHFFFFFAENLPKTGNYPFANPILLTLNPNEAALREQRSAHVARRAEAGARTTGRTTSSPPVRTRSRTCTPRPPARALGQN